MTRKLFTDNEIILCTFIARYGRGLICEKRVSRLEKRSVSSVKMKVQNIAAMLKEEGFEHSPDVSCLSGVTTGLKGRRTNWKVVETLLFLDKQELKEKCMTVVRQRNERN